MKEFMGNNMAQMQELFQAQEKMQENNLHKFICMAEDMICRQEKHMVEFTKMMKELLNNNISISSNETKNQ